MTLNATAADFKIKPFIEKYCIDCHDEDLDKGDRRFDNVNFSEMSYQTGEVYQEMLDVLNLGDMPPKKAKKHPTKKEFATAINWLTNKTSDIREKLDPRSQQTVMRRLNKVEYNYTIRDLFNLSLSDFDPSVAFPDDGEVDGLNTIGTGLVTSDFLLTEMLNSARMVAARVIRPGVRPTVKTLSLKSDSKELGKRYFASRLIGRQSIQLGNRRGWFSPADGTYNIRLKAVMLNRLKRAFVGLLKNYNYDEKSRIAIVAYDTTNTLPYTIRLGEFEVNDEEAGEIKLSVSLRKGAKIRIEWLNGPDGSTKKIKRKIIPKYSKDAVYSVTRNPMEMYVGAGPELQLISAQVDGPHYKQWPLPGFAEFFGKLNDNSSIGELNASLAKLAAKAFRGPLTPGQEYAFAKVAAKKYSDSKNDLWAAAKAGVTAILVSPEFIYQVENGAAKKVGLNDYEIATRLSYFLWSSTPDDRLLTLARQGKLKEKSLLKQEVARMIKDPKSSSFVKNFTDHWLGLKKLGAIQPNPKNDKIYYDYNLAQAMGEEVRLFITDLMQNNRDISALVNANYSYLNEGLAKLYGVSGVKGDHLRKVSFPSEIKGRGGLAGMAGLMTVTGNGIESLPVKRGAWVLEEILGVHAPLPPPDVPEIAPDTTGAKTPRDLLEKHRKKASCASCHAKFDHFGLALENFDQIGRYRTAYGSGKSKININAAVETSAGAKFTGPEGLKRYLTSKSDMVTHGLIERMTTYAIGRRLTFLDKKEVESISHKLKKSGNGLQSLIQSIVSSDLFLNN
jgi:hypothetical protein